MKTVDLNIKISDLKLGGEEAKLKGFEMTKRYLDLAFGLYQSQPDMRGQPKGLAMAEQRKIYKILDVLDKAKDKLELEDDWFDFLYKVFNEVKWVGGTKIVVRIADKLDEAKLKEEKPEDKPAPKPEKPKKAKPEKNTKIKNVESTK